MDINFSKEFETVEKFNSVVDALNYMSAQGWELVNTISSGTVLELHHIMKKRYTE
jgi:purine-cytosine permease-like protein